VGAAILAADAAASERLSRISVADLLEGPADKPAILAEAPAKVPA
jgi:hypothetical protein